jgi:isopentenyl diphosphate isomerase/L-lactate dehydrogenase-like FMN-dependent dehydrogenase
MKTILLNIVLSIAIIFITHQIWDYFKHNYTTAKTKNIVEIQTAKYKQIMEDLQKSDIIEKDERIASSALVLKPNPLAFLPMEEKEWMQKELNEFIDSL